MLKTIRAFFRRQRDPLGQEKEEYASTGRPRSDQADRDESHAVTGAMREADRSNAAGRLIP